MKASSAAVQGILAFTGLAVAYGTWQRDPPTGGTDVVVLDLTRNQVEKIRYDEPLSYAELERRDGEELWIRVGERPPPPIVLPDGGVVDAGPAPSPAPPPVPPERELRASAEAQKVYERFAPLRAARALGQLSPEKLKEVGLADSKRRLAVTAGGVRYAFKVGTPTSGLSTAYLESESDGKVYLLGGTSLADLAAAQGRLVERRLHDFKPSEVDGVVVKANKKQRDFNFSAGESGQNARLSPKDKPDTPDEDAKNWHDKLWGVLCIETLGKGEVPFAGEPKVTTRVEYLSKGKLRGFIELGEVRPTELFARTEFTAGWVQVDSHDKLLEGAMKVASSQ